MNLLKNYFPSHRIIIFLIITMMVSSFHLNGQVINDSIPKSKLSIYMRPLSMMGNSSFQFGVDYRLPSFTRLGLVLGFGSSRLIKPPKVYMFDYFIYEVHPQMQFFLKKEVSTVNFALGGEVIFANIISHLGASSYAPGYNELREFDSATLIDKRRAFHFLGSAVFHMETHFVFELYLGLGFRSRVIEYKDIVNERPVYSSGGLLVPYSSGPTKKSDGEQGGLSATLGFKIGYRF